MLTKTIFNILCNNIKWEITEKVLFERINNILNRYGSKYIVKRIPILSLISGIFFAGQRLYYDDDW